MVDSKNILLSGGARGIGRVIARHFLSKGHRVFILDIEQEELEYTVTQHLSTYKADSRVSSALCDLRDTEAIRASVKKAADFFGGRIDVVINNGGIASPQWKNNATMEDPDTLDQFQAYLDVNLRAPFVVSQAVIPYMKVSTGGATATNVDARREYQAWKDANSLTEAGPCVINVSSFRAKFSDAHQEGYASSKAGLLGLTHSMAVSCGKWGIRVNSVSPGRIKATHESKAGDLEGKGIEYTDKDMNDHTTNRAGKGEDIAEAIEYLVRAGFVTGQDIVVDGGAVIQKK